MYFLLAHFVRTVLSIFHLFCLLAIQTGAYLFSLQFLAVSDTFLARSLWKSSLMHTSALLWLTLQKCCQSQNWYLSRGDEGQSTPRASSGEDSLKLSGKALAYGGLFSNIQNNKQSHVVWKGLGPQAVPPTLWTLVSLCKRALMAPAKKTDKIPESWERQISRQASHKSLWVSTDPVNVTSSTHSTIQPVSSWHNFSLHFV